jgi:hypothetical protein
MAVMGGLAALGSLGLGAYGASQGPPAAGVNIPQPWGGVGGALSGAQTESAHGLPQYNLWNLPLAQQTSMGLFNNPYAAQYQTAAGQTSPYVTGAALNQYGAGGGLYGGGYGVMQTGFDPQQALYQRTAQQVQDQTRAAESASGVATTPYGAGIEAQTMKDFNIDWQNAQLQRQLSALSGAGSAFGQGAQMQQQAPLSYLQGQALPYSTFGAIGGQQMGALSGLGQFGQSASQIPQQQIANMLNLGSVGGGQAYGAGTLGLQQAQQGYNQMAGYGQGMFGGLGGLANYTGWGGGGGGWGYNPFGGYSLNPQVAQIQQGTGGVGGLSPGWSGLSQQA